jgi:hypothetical protein
MDTTEFKAQGVHIVHALFLVDLMTSMSQPLQPFGWTSN